MVEAITLRIDRKSISSVNGMLGRLGRIPDMASSAMQIWGKILERNMVMAASEAGLRHWGKGKLSLFRDIKWRQAKKGRIGRLFMPMHGVKLDTLPTRRVIVKRGTLLDKWVRDPTRIGRPMKHITVHRYPFIKRGYMLSRPHLNTLLKQKIKIGGTT